MGTTISSQADFRGIAFEESDDEDELYFSVFPDKLQSQIDKSVNMAEELKQKFEVLDNGNDRRCYSCYTEKRIESTNSLQRGEHICIAQQHSKTYFGKESSLYQHHAIVMEIYPISNETAIVFIDFSKDTTSKVIKIIKEDCILDLKYDKLCVCEYFYYKSHNVILQMVDSIMRKSVEWIFFKRCNLLINNCEHIAKWCIVGKDERFRAHSLIASLVNTLPNVPRKGSQAAILLPKIDSIVRKSVEWNFLKRLGTHLMQSLLSEDCTESDLWKFLIELDYQLQCLARVLNEQQSVMDKVADKEQVMIPPQGERTFKSHEGVHVVVEDKNAKVKHHCFPHDYFGQALSSTAFQQNESPTALVQRTMLPLLQENADKLRQDTGKSSPLTMWDFAGQCTFYTTHQTFLTRRAIYFLVSDVSEKVTDIVADEYYFDSERKMKCNVIAKMLEGAECRFMVKGIKDTDELYLRSYEKEIHNARILHPFINLIIGCAESVQSQSADRVLYLMYPYMENGVLRSSINLENSTKNLCTKEQESNLQIWTCCAFQIACVVGYLCNSSFGRPIFLQDVTFHSTFLAGNFSMKICDFGIAVEAKQNATVANWTRVQGTHGYNAWNMYLDKYNASYDIFNVGVHSDSACYLQTIRGQEWLRRAIHGTRNTSLLSTLAPKCCKQSVSFLLEKLYQIWLDQTECIEDRKLNVSATDERIKTRENYLLHIFEMCTVLLLSNRRCDQHELNHPLQFVGDTKNLACSDEWDSFSEGDVAVLISTVMKMQSSSSLPTADQGVQQGTGTEDLSGSISWDSNVSLRAPEKQSLKCRKKNTVDEIQLVDSVHTSLKDFFERKFTTFDQMEDDGNETEQQIQFGIMQHEQSNTEFDEQNVRDIGLKDRKKSDFHSTIWLTRNPLPLPNLNRDVIVGFVDGQTSDELREILTQLASDNILEPQTTMKYEMLRLCTMKSFPGGNRPFAIRIIAAGFYYGGYQDQVICYCCGSRKNNWVLEDLPLLIHQKMTPSCSFLTHNAVVNIPIRRANSPLSAAEMRLLVIQRSDGSNQPDTTQVASSLMLTSSEQNHVKISNGTHQMLVTNKGSPPNQLVSSEGQNVLDNRQTSSVTADFVEDSQPKYPHYAVRNMRINSFHDWPAELHQRPEEMADCGFFYAGFSDCVRCFYCGVGLRHWMSEDDPWIEHARWSISCVYVLKMKGQEFVSLVKMAVEIAEKQEATSNNGGANQSPTNNTETFPADTAKEDSHNNTANNSTAPGDSTNSTGATCGAGCSAAAPTPSPGNAEIQKYLLTDAAQSVLDMGYQPKLVLQAIKRVLMKIGTEELTGQIIMEAVFEIEEEGAAKSKPQPSSQSAKENERNEKANDNYEENNKQDSKQGGNFTPAIIFNCVFSEGNTYHSVVTVTQDIDRTAEGTNGEEVQIDPEKIRKEHRELHETTLCKICLDNTISVVFLPCGHLVTCPDCAPAMRKCPICRTLIKGTVKIFFG